jgi:outer membrane protein assembly factor BamB
VSIERVAHSVGYASKDVFCRAFERRFGVSPRVYRSRFSVVAMLLMPPARVAAQNGGAGHWEGTMQRGRSALSIAVDFPPGPGGGGAGGGLFTAGGLGAMDVPQPSPLLGSDGTIYVLAAGKLVALSDLGTTLWELPLPSDAVTSPTLAPDGTLYIATSDNTLYAVQTTSKGLLNSAWPKYQRDLWNSGSSF